MKRIDPKPYDAPQGVRADELLPLRGLLARLNVGRKTVWQWERLGLRGVTVGKCRFFLGRDVLQFFGRLADQQQANGDGDGGPAGEGRP